MRINSLEAIVKTALRGAAVLLFGAGAASAQVSVNLTAGPATATLPDGSAVPMWGYSCATGSTNCAPLNPAATSAATWSPVVITVPTGQSLTINLTNGLTFGANSVPTSLVIVGQVGGGLGNVAQRTTTASPDHSNAQTNIEWPIAGSSDNPGTPPAQGPRVQSFSTEVVAGSAGPGQCASPCALPPWTAPRPGTYLLESGTHPSIQGPMGLYGIVVVTTAPTSGAPGTAYPAAGTTTAVTYNAEVPLLFSEIDPVQNLAVNTAVNNPAFSETMVWSGQPGGCGNPASTSGPTPFGACYPPAVNYTPLYYLINGVAFNKTNSPASLFPTAPATGVSTAAGSTVLVRMVNAGLRMHVPSIVGSQTGLASPAPAGFSLIAEDGNTVPGNARVQSEVFMAAGKTFDVMINVPTSTTALPVFDRELSLSGGGIGGDSGMLAYIGVNGAVLPTAGSLGAAVARADTYNFVAKGQTITVSDPGKGVIANDTNVYGVQVLTAPTGGTLVLNADGTFTYTAGATTTSDSFTYCANGTVTGTTCSSGLTATVTLGAATIEAASGITVNPITYTSNLATSIKIAPAGVLSVDKDAAGYPLSVALSSIVAASGLTLAMDINGDGGFSASVTSAGTYTFTYKAQNSQGTVSSTSATVTLVFPAATGLAVTVLDGTDKKTVISDYRWIIEEDRTFYINPNCTTNPPPAGCPGAASGVVPTFGTNFHTSYMPLVATGCTGTLSCESGQMVGGVPAVCDIGNGVCRTNAAQETIVMPSAVHLDPTKRYYISILPGDAANPFANAYGGSPSCASTPDTTCGHGMGGAPISFGQTAVTLYTQPSPYPPSKLSVFVFEDDFPLNGEQDAGGGIDVLATNEPGLGGFNITLFDDAGGTGDATGQMTYDMFNQPLSNSLAGTIDPATGKDACPISVRARSATNADGTIGQSATGITGTIVTCPKFEADGHTLSPLAGQAIVANLMPGRYGVVATPGADRIGRGEEWLQTNTLDGQKAHDSFLRIGEPNFFQEFGPAGYHVTIGFANPAIINSRKSGVCGGTDPNLTASNCTNTVTGLVTTERMSRTPDERLYSSGSNDSFAFTQCYVSLGDTDGEDFAFTKCNGDGTFTLTGIPDGNWRLTVFDQWNDMLVDGLSTPVGLGPGYGLCQGTGSTTSTCNMGQIAMNQWQANIYTTTFFDTNGNGVRDANEDGLALVATNIRFRDGSYSNFNNTDLEGNAGFNEVFPLFSWYVIETDTTRYKNTGIHVVYDAGGPADGTPGGGGSTIAQFMANTLEPSTVALPAALRVPGAHYCATADCTDAPSPVAPGGTGGSTGRVDPPWVYTEGWQGFSGQNSFLEFGKKPYAPGETGGIHGEVIYASTRPFDDPALLIHTSWTPDVPGVTINLYQEGTAADGVTQTLTLVDSTKTSSWDDWAQGFRTDGNPNMNCPGQSTTDLFYFTLFNQPMYLDEYNNGGTPLHPIPNNSQFKCYDGMHNWNQLQPATYDGAYQFPSVVGMDPATGKPTGTGTAVNPAGGSVPGTNCTICVPNHAAAATDWNYGTPMLPAGKYVVEMIVPPGYELVKEEDKNILIGDNYIAPVTQQFGGLGDIYILPDQAAIASTYNANNPNNPTTDLGRPTLPQGEGDTGSVEQFWPCVGASRVVPDFISLFPQSAEVAPFAGATRNLCDRKEVTLQEQQAALAKFWVFTSAHAAAHFTGVITDDFTSEFDPFSPQFGEKFSPPNMPIAIKDWSGTEISRVYTDQWGTYNGLTYSTWEVNPPNPTGYAPTMMVTCMNDPGTGTTPDPLFNPEYSQFCYEIPFMPGQTQYMDTPVVPTSAFAGAGYNNPDCNYPVGTPAIKEVDGDGIGPWVAAASGHHLTITALGDQQVPNNAYAGPSATMPPFDQKTVTRHYGFGSTKGTVTIGGVAVTAANITTWTDTTIVVNVPSGVPNCTIQQQAQYGGTTAQCGQLAITRGDNNLQSIDAVTVTIGGKAPTHVLSSGTIQSAIDTAQPGDLLIVDPGVHQELVLMWKPVRLQGAGAASSIINANTQPAGKLNPWRAKVNCLFGLALNGQPTSNGRDVPLPGGGGFEANNPYDPTGQYNCGGWTAFHGGDNNPQVDRLPLEAVVGWDTTLNGNLAELLQEPSLMGAYEGAGITVLAKGVRYPRGVEVFGTGADTSAGSNIAHEGQMPLGTVLLTNSNADCNTLSGSTSTRTGYSSNFNCNPSRIDGLSITDSSQGGGGIFAHAWTHNLEISNNRVYNNTGTLTGGITVGQGESPDALLAGNGGDPLAPTGGFDQQPWTCVPGAITGSVATGFSQNATPSGFLANDELPFCYNVFVNVHHNAVTQNSSIGDEVFSGTPAGAGGVTFCSGADYYKFNYNWVCGNLSSGDGGGVAHLGFTYKGDIEHNSFLFNQSTNPTIPTNGGGVVIMGGAPDGVVGAPGTPECGSVTDIDCAPGLSDGTGPGLVINANLMMGNGAESGSGGGIRFQDVDGAEVAFFPNGSQSVTRRDVGVGFCNLNTTANGDTCTANSSGSTTYPTPWYSINVTNNIIANNVAGWDGGGVSLQDALAVNFINNTVASNDSTASSGVLFNTLGASGASAPGSNCVQPNGTSSCPQAAGLVTMRNTAALTASLQPPAVTTVTCPTGHGTAGNCMNFSVPLLDNDVFWQNRSFYIGVGSLGTGNLNQQNVVALYNAFSTTPAPSQPQADATTVAGGGVIITGGTGACVSGVSYWDLGVRGDTGPTNHGGGLTLGPTYSVITTTTGYTGTGNTAGALDAVSQYCNGSRVPPELGSMGYQVPPGIADATVPNPIFSLTPAATVDEGNNWINMSWGPLTLTNTSASTDSGAMLGNYGPTTGSSVIGLIPSTATANYNEAPSVDFYGNQRKNGSVDAGAVEFVAGGTTAIASVTGGPLAFGNVAVGTTSAAQTLTLHNTGTATLGGIAVAFAGPYSRPGGTCGTTLAAGATCTITVVFHPTAIGPANGTATITASVAVTGSPVTLTGTGAAASATLTPTSHNYGSQTRNCPTPALACALDPIQTYTLSNTGNVTLTGIAQGVLGGANAADFFVNRALSTCGPAGNGQLLGRTTLAPGATCVVTLQFRPLTAEAIGTKTATISVTDAAGTQTSTLTGNAQ
jgi:Bacterial cadherin-like domain